MKKFSWYRLMSVLITGLGTLGLVMGSVLLARVDPAMVVQRPTRSVNIPAPTLYPTLSPETATIVPVTPNIALSPTPATPVVNPCSPPVGWVRHEVQAGETLFALAVVYGTNVYALMQANCLETADIAPGQMLYLPSLQATPTAYQCSGPPPTWRIRYVQQGDTLYSLATQYGTNVEAIRRANCMAGVTLYAGQPLYLPPVIVITPTFPPPTPVNTATWTPAPPTPQITLTPTLAPTTPVTITPTAVPPSPTVTAPPASPTPTPTSTVPVTPTLPPTSTPTLEVTVTPTPTPGTPTVTPTPGTPTPTPTPGTPTATVFTTATASPTPVPSTATTAPSSSPTATLIPATQVPPTATPTVELLITPSPTPGE